jgi:HD superfamily phosphohydrolase YqeK
MRKNREKITTFRRELTLIKDYEMRRFVETLLDEADDAFFKKPASASGKFHNVIQNGVGGLVIHTKDVVYFTKRLIETEMFDVKGYEDHLISAAIIHDICKYTNTDGEHTNLEHPKLAAEYIRRMYDKYLDSRREAFYNNTNTTDILKAGDLEIIVSAVETHMGKWGEKEPTTDVDKVLHIADFLASRNGVYILRKY